MQELEGAPASNSHQTDRAVSLGLWLVVAVYLLHAKALWNFTIDDAYISFRYAKNLVAGHGIVFNVGERVEGYTNLLWVLLMTIPEALRFDSETFAKALGLFFGGVCLLLTFQLGRRLLGDRGPVALAAPAALAVQSPFVLWSVSGLETAMGAALFLGGLLAFLHETHGRKFPWSALLFLGAGLTHPDLGLGILIVLILGGAGLIPACGEHRKRAARLSFAALALMGAIYLGWKYSYYGSLLPNTYYAKSLHGVTGFIKGAKYIWKFLAYSALVPAAVMIAAPLISERRKALALPLAIIAAYWLYVLSVGGDWMPLFRFFFVALPFHAVLAQSLIGDLLARRLHDSKPHGVIAFAPLLAAILIALPGLLMIRPLPRHAYYIDGIEREAKWLDGFKLMGRSLGPALPKNILVACDIAGAFPYFSGLAAIDMDGLTDAHIARNGKDEGRLFGKRDIPYVLDRSPEIIFLFPPVNPFDNRAWTEETVLDRVADYMDEPDLRRRFLAEYRHGVWQVKGFYINAMIRRGFDPSKGKTASSTDCVTPHSGMLIDKSASLCPGKYPLSAEHRNAAITIKTDPNQEIILDGAGASIIGTGVCNEIQWGEKGFVGSGIFIEPMTSDARITIKNLTIERYCTGIDSFMPKNITIIGNHFKDNPPADYGAHGDHIQIVAGVDIEITGNSFDGGFNEGIYFSHSAEKINLSHNSIKGVQSNGIAGSCDGVCKNITIDSNTIDSVGGDGIDLIGADDLTIAGNAIRGVGANGILLTDAANGAIRGNTIDGTKREFYPINLVRSSGFTVSENRLDRFYGKTVFDDGRNTFIPLTEK